MEMAQVAPPTVNCNYIKQFQVELNNDKMTSPPHTHDGTDKVRADVKCMKVETNLRSLLLKSQQALTGWIPLFLHTRTSSTHTHTHTHRKINTKSKRSHT